MGSRLSSFSALIGASFLLSSSASFLSWAFYGEMAQDFFVKFLKYIVYNVVCYMKRLLLF